MKKIIVSILHYEHVEDTLACLSSLKNLDLEGLKILTVVLDNGSKGPLKIPEKEYESLNLKYIRSEKNLGFTGGHNRILKFVKNEDFDFFLLLNNDCVLEKKCLGELVSSMNGNRKLGGVVPKIYFTKGHEFHKDKYHEYEKGKVIWFAGGEMDWKNVKSKHLGVDEVDNGQYDTPKKIDFATGACFLIKKEVIKKTFLFDDRYFLYYEDADLCQRILKMGFDLEYKPSAVAWHNNAGSSGPGSNLHDYYLTRNRMLFGIKFAPIRVKTALVRESVKLSLKGRKWQKVGIRDFYLRKFGKGSYTGIEI
jgi:GT2 family glycosyltransferase